MSSSNTVIFKKRSTAGIPEKTIISARFVIAVELLIKKGHFKDQVKFAQHYGYAKQLISNIKAGRQDVAIELLYNVVMDWKINPGFIFGIDDIPFVE